MALQKHFILSLLILAMVLFSVPAGLYSTRIESHSFLVLPYLSWIFQKISLMADLNTVLKAIDIGLVELAGPVTST
jgi:hypothetical protein